MFVCDCERKVFGGLWSSGQGGGREGKRRAFGFWNSLSLGSESLFGVSVCELGKGTFFAFGQYTLRFSGIGYSRIGHEICLY